MTVISFKPHEIRLIAEIFLKPENIIVYKYDFNLILDKFYKALVKRSDKNFIKTLQEDFYKKLSWTPPTTYKKR